jgi:eukaryotic-like serine/threonine-protein kinase
MPRTSDKLPRAHGSDPDAWRSHDSRLTADEVTRDSAASHTDGGDADGPEHRERASGYLDHTARIGRFAVLRQLGEGGMGVVYSAYDEQLDRRVALKLLRPGRDNSERNQSRMQREARAMAKLSHPNVVQVYEVGRFEEQVFLAMEFVQGKTLGAWLKAAPRTWQQILYVMVQAGRGLHAAHEAGVIHADFKPDNILIDAQDRARVVDFGLSRRADPAGSSLRAAAVPGDAGTSQISPVPTRELEATPASSDLDESARREGEHPRSNARIAGTPAYMAPEQHRHSPADQRSDQFSFCITLYTALYGKHPFAGGSLLELVINLTDGRIHEPPPGTPVPADVHAAVVRGLAVDPDARWPSMHELLAELERGSGRAPDPEFDLSVARRQRIVLSSVIAVSIFTVSVLILASASDERHLPSPQMNALAGAVINALMLGLIFVFREQLMQNTINRRVMGWLIVSSLAMLVHRTIALLTHVPVASTMVNDLIMLGSIAALAAVTVERWIGWTAAVLLAGALLASIFPGGSALILASAIVGVFILAVLFWSR